MKKVIVLLAILAPVFASASTTIAGDSLGTNNAISNKLIESLMNPEQAEKFLAAPYTGFYQIQGNVKNNKLRFNKVKSKVSYPDDSLEPLALGLADLIEIPVYSTGSRIKTRATAYIAFYRDQQDALGVSNAVPVPTSVEKEPNTIVLVIIKQKETSNARNPNMRLANAEVGKRDGSKAYFFELAM